MSIWDDEDVDWTSGDGLRVAQLFERAYADRQAARYVADEVGLSWPKDASTLSHPDLWGALLGTAARDGRLLDLAADLLGDTTRNSFSIPLRQLLGERLGGANAQRVARHGLPRSADESTAVLASLDLASTTQALLPNGLELESIADASGGLLPLASAVQVFLDARRRVALVRRGLAPVGTGFLVGPDLLLTAAHVIWPHSEPRPDDLDGLDIVLDYYDQGRSIAETGTLVPVTELLRASLASDEEFRGSLLTWDAPEDRLDYALLRLGRRAGEDATTDTGTRGWYELDTEPTDLSRPSLVSIFHFPLGTQLTWSQLLGSPKFNPSGTQTRMRYRTNTMPGSSGGPIVDGFGRLLGLHHLGTIDVNQAIPGWRIGRMVNDLLTEATAELEAADAASERKPWFEDLPLDFTRDETRTAERLLIVAYPTNIDAVFLAENAGLDRTELSQTVPVRYLMREILVKARMANRLRCLLAEVLEDPNHRAIHPGILGGIRSDRATIATWRLR